MKNQINRFYQTKFIYGGPLKETMLSFIKKDLLNLKTELKPGLAIVQVGNNPILQCMMKYNSNAAKYCDFVFKSVILPKDVEEKEIISSIEQLNNDQSIHGIQILLPFYCQTFPNVLNCLNSIIPQKNVENLTTKNFELMINKIKQEGYIPCTAAAALSIIYHTGWVVKGLKISVIGDGLTAGGFLGANVSSFTERSGLSMHEISQSDLIVLAAGKSGLIDQKFLKQNSAVIDCGYFSNEGKYLPCFENYNYLEKLSWITPIPGGLGPVSISWIVANVFESYRRSIKLTPMNFFEQACAEIFMAKLHGIYSLVHKEESEKLLIFKALSRCWRLRSFTSKMSRTEHRSGDWICVDPQCGYSNFSWRNSCNSCHTPRGDGEGTNNYQDDRNFRKGPRQFNDRGDDWTCSECGYSNFARRWKCNSCSTPKENDSNYQRNNRNQPNKEEY